MSKKSKHVCDIHTWLGREDPDLAQAVEAVCMARSLNVSPGSPGLTFLKPGEKVRNKIIELAASTSREDGKLARKMIEAHSIPMCVTSADMFKEIIGSRAGILLTAKEVGKDTAELASGKVSVKKVATFAALQDNYAVWEVTKGEVPLEGEKFDPRMIRRRGKTGGGSSYTKQSADNCLFKDFQSYWARGEVVAARHVYHEAISGLLSCLAQQGDSLYTAALCLLDRDPVASWFVISSIVPDGVFTTWGGNRDQGRVEDHVLKFFENPAACVPAQARGAAIFSNPTGVFEASCSIADNLLTNNPTPENLKRVYADAIGSNQVGSVTGVWPAEVLPFLKNKLWQDLFRTHIKLLFAEMDSTNLCTDLRSLRESLPGTDPDAEFMRYACGDLGDGTVEVATRDKLVMVLPLPGSTNFLYFPRATALVTQMGSDRNYHKDPRTAAMHNADASAHIGLTLATQKAFSTPAWMPS